MKYLHTAHKYGLHMLRLIMDGRVKPGHDGGEAVALGQPTYCGLMPALLITFAHFA
jgi:hypothetical protein